MIELSKIATNIQCGKDGIWYTKQQAQVSYPEQGNVLCRRMEEKSFWFKHRNKCIVEAIRLCPPDGEIFDIGGGNGYVCLAIKNAGIETVLVEPGFEGAMNAHTRGLSPIVCAAFEDAGFKEHTIPAIGLFDIVEHIEDDISFLKDVNRALIPNGRVYITVPAYKFLFSFEDTSARHYRRYTISSLTKKLKSVGFRIDFKTYIFGFLPIPIFFVRTIPSAMGWRRKYSFEKNVKEHSKPANWFGALLTAALDMEIKVLRNKRVIPFGGSCLVVATVPKE